MIYYFSSKTGNTRRFVEKLPKEYAKFKIENKGNVLMATQKFILFVATYANCEGKNAIPKHVIEFIKNNKDQMVGVISSGNKNFGKYYGISGDIIARNCNVPLLYKYELFGTENDANEVSNILHHIKFN